MPSGREIRILFSCVCEGEGHLKVAATRAKATARAAAKTTAKAAATTEKDSGIKPLQHEE